MATPERAALCVKLLFRFFLFLLALCDALVVSSVRIVNKLVHEDNEVCQIFRRGGDAECLGGGYHLVVQVIHLQADRSGGFHRIGRLIVGTRFQQHRLAYIDRVQFGDFVRQPRVCTYAVSSLFVKSFNSLERFAPVGVVVIAVLPRRVSWHCRVPSRPLSWPQWARILHCGRLPSNRR